MRNIQKIWKKWRNFTKNAATHQSKFLLNLIYFVFIAPIAVVFKIISNPLNLGGKPHWINKESGKIGMNELKNQ